MSRFERWSRIPFWPLLAKCVVVVWPIYVAVFAILYPAREREAAEYARAAVCAPGVKDSSNCRAVVDAEYVDSDCQNNTFPDPDDFCEMQLHITGLTRYIGLDRQRAQSLTRGAHLRVEVFRTAPTRAEIYGKFVDERGSPQQAVRWLKLTFAVWTVLAAVAAIYLYWRKRRSAG